MFNACRRTKLTSQAVHRAVASGGKWWRLKYRHSGKEKRLGLGTFPDTGFKMAREAHDNARQQIAAGVDPSAERKTAKEAARLASLHSLERGHARNHRPHKILGFETLPEVFSRLSSQFIASVALQA